MNAFQCYFIDLFLWLTADALVVNQPLMGGRFTQAHGPPTSQLPRDRLSLLFDWSSSALNSLVFQSAADRFFLAGVGPAVSGGLHGIHTGFHCLFLPGPHGDISRLKPCTRLKEYRSSMCHFYFGQPGLVVGQQLMSGVLIFVTSTRWVTPVCAFIASPPGGPDFHVMVMCGNALTCASPGRHLLVQCLKGGLDLSRLDGCPTAHHLHGLPFPSWKN